MSGPYPLTYCDRECAAANGCVVGGMTCSGCGRYFCAHELLDGLCADCEAEAEEARARKEEEKEDEEE
ncbi:MAG: hypothetical protein II649_06690 [Kiritimatiellae bacterium]|nr:hypothetical protein [Kiritimatiellia bacterium]